MPEQLQKLGEYALHNEYEDRVYELNHVTPKLMDQEHLDAWEYQDYLHPKEEYH